MTPEVRARVTRELESLNWKTKLVESPDAVIYSGVPSTLSVSASDVLVLVRADKKATSKKALAALLGGGGGAKKKGKKPKKIG